MTWLDVGGQRWSSHLGSSMWWQRRPSRHWDVDCRSSFSSLTDLDAVWGLTHVGSRKYVLDGVKVIWIHSRREGWQVGDFGTRVNPAEAAKPIKMPFERLTRVSPRNHVSHRIKVGQIHSLLRGWRVGDAAFCQNSSTNCSLIAVVTLCTLYGRLLLLLLLLLLLFLLLFLLLSVLLLVNADVIVDQPHWICTFKESCLSGCEAGEFPCRPDVKQKIRHDTYNRLWSCQRVCRSANSRAHIVQRAQKLDWHRTIHEYQHSSGQRFVISYNNYALIKWPCRLFWSACYCATAAFVHAFVRLFIQTDLVTTVSHEWLEESRWNCTGNIHLPLRMTWLDSAFWRSKVKVTAGRSLGLPESASQTLSRLVQPFLQVCDWRTFPIMCSTCSWWVTTYVDKPFATKLAN